jgi:type I restriction enzyme S subunit
MSRYKAYPTYRDSQSKWLGVIPNHWNLFDGKRLFSSRRELAREDDEQLAASQKYGVVPQSLMMEMNDAKVMLALKGTSTFRHVGKNDFVISLRSFEGGIEHSSYVGCVSPAYTVLQAEKAIVPAYFKYLLKSAPYIAALQASTDSLRDGKSISYEQFGAIALPYPVVDEQAAIADFLDHKTAKIDALIEKQQRLIELLKEKRQAVISHAVTKGLNPNAPMKDSGVEWLGGVPAHWKVATARRFLLEHKQGYYSTEDYVDDGVKLLRITDLRDLGEIDSSNSPRVKRIDALKSFLLRKGDVVFARTGGAGSFGVVPDQHEDLAYASYLIRFRFAHTYFIYPYLRFMFASDNFQLAVKENIHGGVNQNLHAEDIKNTFIAVPPIEEQEQISTYLSRQSAKYSHLIAKAESTVELMQERRSALISAAVTGKIDVRDWQAAA